MSPRCEHQQLCCRDSKARNAHITKQKATSCSQKQPRSTVRHRGTHAGQQGHPASPGTPASHLLAPALQAELRSAVVSKVHLVRDTCGLQSTQTRQGVTSRCPCAHSLFLKGHGTPATPQGMGWESRSLSTSGPWESISLSEQNSFLLPFKYTPEFHMQSTQLKCTPEKARCVSRKETCPQVPSGRAHLSVCFLLP